MRKDQWSVYEPDKFQVEMQWRAAMWSGTQITTAGSSRSFFEELARAGLIEIVNQWKRRTIHSHATRDAFSSRRR